MITTCTATLITAGQQLATAVARPRGKPLGFFMAREYAGDLLLLLVVRLCAVRGGRLRAYSSQDRSSSRLFSLIARVRVAPPLRRLGAHPISCALVDGVRLALLGFLFLAICFSHFVFAATGSEHTTSATVDRPWAQFVPYVPEKNEYFFEMGGQWERENMSWFGLGYGRYLSSCWQIHSERCQQYLDFNLGVGHIMGVTEALFLVGPRWQYVMFPKPFSPSFQVFSGVMDIRDSTRDKEVFVYGVGAGLSMTLHKKLTMKWDNRMGGGDEFWFQSMISFSLKIDDWVDQFGEKMKKIGHTTVETTGTILKSPKTLMDWFNRPKESDSPSNQQ